MRRFVIALATAILLSSPTLGLYVAHVVWAWKLGRTPTGFVHYDMPYYAANARQYLDGGASGLAYSNPYDVDPHSPPLYFQPLTLLLAGLMRITHLDPGLLFAAIGLLATLAAMLALLALCDRCCSARGGMRLWLQLLVAWGGGCLVLVSWLDCRWHNLPLDLFLDDPHDGFWMLNFGRNFIFPTEAFYHLLVLLVMLAVAVRRLRLALAIVWLLALSHPFTGMQYALIFAAWVSCEWLWAKCPHTGPMRGRGSDSQSGPSLALRASETETEMTITLSTVCWACLPLAVGAVYYLGFLPRYESHRALVAQWSQYWVLTVKTMVAAYCLVGLLVLLRFRFRRTLSLWLDDPLSRFLLLGVGISLLLANHDLFIAPRQPLHFTRGHIWLPLCLVGLPLIAAAWDRLATAGRRRAGVALAAVFTLVMLADNAMFFGQQYSRPPGFMLSTEQRALFAELARCGRQTVLLADDPVLSYLAASYTAARPYLGHLYNTPHVEEKIAAVAAFFAGGAVPVEIGDRPLAVAVVRDDHAARLSHDARFQAVWRQGELRLFLRKP
jgi:hypothetical protein